MFPSHSPEQATIAKQLAEELDRYEQGLRKLLERRWDAELYRALADRFDRMQMFAQALPRLSVSWTELLISRAELTHALWMVHAPGDAHSSVLAAHARHEECIHEVSGKCRRYFHDGAG